MAEKQDFKFAEIKATDVQEELFSYKSTSKEVITRFAKNKVAIFGAIVFLVLLITSFVVMLLPNYSPDAVVPEYSDLGPSAGHWFGYDTVGRDLWSRCWAGLQYSMILALVTTTLNVLIAILIGLLMGYFDRFDRWFSGVIKIMYALPTIIVLIVFSVVFTPSAVESATGIHINNESLFSFWVLVISLTFSGWVNASQQIRGVVKKTRNLDFITASQTLGTNRISILKTFFVYSMPIVIVQYAIIFPRMIISESILGFLGLSIPDLPTLGNLINNGRISFLSFPHELLFPLMMLVVTTVSIQLIGFGLEDAVLGKDGR